jgi:dihydrofolate reductase
MAKLIYAALTSLDGFIADQAGKFDWAVPDEEVHAFINDLERRVGTYLYGRRMYETMAAWETPEIIPDRTPAILDFATIWQAADKVVYSRTLAAVHTARTRLERVFDSAAIRRLKAQSPRDIAVGGPALAAHAIRAGLVDEYHLFLAPIVVGGGNAFFPAKVRVTLELLDQRSFANGMVHVRYRGSELRVAPGSHV